jgi:hypothetical protein
MLPIGNGRWSTSGLALPIMREVGDRAGEAVTHYNVAMIHREQGELGQAVAELEQVVELESQVRRPDLQSGTEMLYRVRQELASARIAMTSVADCAAPVGGVLLWQGLACRCRDSGIGGSVEGATSAKRDPGLSPWGSGMAREGRYQLAGTPAAAVAVPGGRGLCCAGDFMAVVSGRLPLMEPMLATRFARCRRRGRLGC